MFLCSKAANEKVGGFIIKCLLFNKETLDEKKETIPVISNKNGDEQWQICSHGTSF